MAPAVAILASLRLYARGIRWDRTSRFGGGGKALAHDVTTAGASGQATPGRHGRRPHGMTRDALRARTDLYAGQAFQCLDERLHTQFTSPGCLDRMKQMLDHRGTGERYVQFAGKLHDEAQILLL